MAAKRVLVIDDEADIREIAKASLQITKKWDVITAASGEEGLAIAATQELDAILLDVAMPNIDGLATLNSLRENPMTEHIPVILLTATVKTAMRQSYSLLGAKAVLMKPFDPGVIGDQIEAALGWTSC